MLGKCSRCGSKKVAEIGVELGDGTSISLTSCHWCESREWRERGRAISLDRVLEMTARSRPH